jgi:hypothetical protein
VSQQEENNGKVWNEGRQAYAAGVPEKDCPYDMNAQWGDWADWVCGHGAAAHEEFTKQMHQEARDALLRKPKKFPVDRAL